MGFIRATTNNGSYLWSRLDEGEAEERIASVLKQFLQCDDQAPRVRTVDDEPLQQHTDDLLTDIGVVLLGVINAKQTEDGEAEEVGVAVGIAELVRHCAEQVVTSLWLHDLGKFF